MSPRAAIPPPPRSHRLADPDDARSLIVRAVENRMGLRLQKGLFGLIDIAARDLIRSQHASSNHELIRRLAEGPDDDVVVQRLRHAASICETYFFRHPEQLEALFEVVERHLLEPKRKRGVRQLSVWSAGSSTGEEAYTLAMLFATRAADFQLQVLGTDMNANALRTAADGIYRARSFRNPVAKQFRSWLIETGQGGFRVSNSLKARVRFLPLNLVTDSYPSPERSFGNFDVVVCRNVLMYLEPSLVPEVMAKLARSGSPECVIALTPAEHSAGQHLPHFKDASHALFTRAAARIGQRNGVPHAPTLAATHVSRRIRPASGPAALERAQVAADRGEFSKAQDLIGDALRQSPDSAHAYLLLGRVVEAAGRPDQALKEFERALFLDRTLVEAELGLAQTLAKLGQSNSARLHFELALRLMASASPASAVGSLGVSVEVARRIAEDGLAGAK